MAAHVEPESGKAITKIAVAGLKSIRDRQEIELRPLTILAGPNSSGKSSIMQGLLLLKQTLEVPYDPGALLIRGPNAAFTSVDQMLYRSPGKPQSGGFEISIAVEGDRELKLLFGPAGRGADGPIKHISQTVSEGSQKAELSPNMNQRELDASLEHMPSPFLKIFEPAALHHITVVRSRCFLEANISHVKPKMKIKDFLDIPFTISFSHLFDQYIESVIHLPGLRGNPERTYPLTAIGRRFPGTFQNYVASVISRWASDSDGRLNRLGEQLAALRLTWKVEARSFDDTQVELRVGRLAGSRRGGAMDLVNIADVGLGVSQTLPVLVSLLVARPGQVVYIEQPEIHLHPKAQFQLAEAIVEAANRGVRAVIETHSSLLLLGVQALVAERRLSPEKVKLHWFERDDTTGATSIRSADLDEAGRFGDWPEDFGDVTLEAESRYLDAAESRLAQDL